MAEVGKLAKNDLRSKALSGMVSVLTGRPVEAREILGELRPESGPPNFSFAYYCAALHALLGEKDEAFAYLEKARQGRALALAYLAIAPEFESLRDDPRFRELLLRIGFPSATSSLRVHL